MGGQDMPGQGMPSSYVPYQQGYGYSSGQPQQPAPGAYGYAPVQQPASQPYGYGQQPVQSPYGYTQSQQGGLNSYGAPQQGMPNAYGTSQQGVTNAYGAPQQGMPNTYGAPQQGTPNTYGTPQPQPAPGPYGYRQPQPSPGNYGYGQPQQTGYQRPQAYPPYQGMMVPQPGPQEPPAPQPPVKKPRKPVNVDGITRLTVFLALPLLVVLFILSMVFGTQVWLKWAFAVPALLVILAMWIRPIVTSDLKLTISFVMGAMIVVAVVSALSGTPKDNTLPPTGGGQNVQGSSSAAETPAPQQLVDVPQAQPNIPAPTDPPQVSSGLESDAARQLETFLYLWQNNDADQMLSLCAPSWVNKQALPLNSIFAIMTNRTPVDWEMTNITGTDNDSSRTISLTINIDRNNGREPRKYLFKVIMLKENDNWYVDPDSLDSNEPEATPTPESAFITQPPQPPAASGPDQVLYYNPRGGSKYHVDPDCTSVDKRFKPMTAITFADLFTDDYDELMACSVCGAPLKEN